MQAVESYIKQKGGRYLHILSCDIPSYQPARQFFASRGYNNRVAEMPNYYVPGKGRVDFYKEF